MRHKCALLPSTADLDNVVQIKCQWLLYESIFIYTHMELSLTVLKPLINNSLDRQVYG